jgi:DNA primase
MSEIEELKSRLDIVDVVKQYVPDLKRTGRSYKGRCPFHNEKTPSFIVTPDIGIFKCFGCGEGGDVISFIQKIERVEFGQALNLAAERAGFELKKNYSEKDEFLKKEKARVIEANKLAAKFWNYILKSLPAGKPGRDYMRKRNIRPEEMQKFVLGYAPKGNNLKNFLVSKGYNITDLINWGLLIERDGKVMDKFRDRLILPILDLQGNPIGFSGRIVGPSDYAPKYLNSSETLVYKKGEILMGIYQASRRVGTPRDKSYLILEEGNIDLLSSHKVGINNIVATGGTALTEQQCKLIKRYADIVYFAFDSDAAGLKALLKGIEICERIELKHKVIPLGKYQDPDDMINQEPQQWINGVANPVNSMSHLLQVYQQDVDLGTADGKTLFTERMVSALKLLEDEVQKLHFAEQVSLLVGVPKQVISDQLLGNRQMKFEERPAEAQEPVTAVQSHASPQEIYLLALLIQMKDLSNVEISTEIFSDVNCRELFIKLTRLGNTDYDFTQIFAEISDGASEVLQQVLLIDTSTITDVEQEFAWVYRVLYGSYLQTQILAMRQQLANEPENANLLTKLQYFTTEKHNLKSSSPFDANKAQN